MTEPKTVANLPIDVSIRWAEDQKLLEESKPIIQDATLASTHAQTEVIQPSKRSEIDLLFDLSKLHPSWANFQKPPGFLSVRQRIFRSQLIPLLGSDEQQDSLMTRIESIKGESEKDDELEQEKNKILKLLKLMQTLNKDLIDITTRCKQYQKG